MPVHILAAFDAEVLIEERAREALDDAVGLGPLHAGGAVLDVLELQEELVKMLGGATAELAAIVGKSDFDLRAADLSPTN